MAQRKKRDIAPNTYVNIQSFMVNELDLGTTELIIYATIYGFCQNGLGEFTGNRNYLAEWCKAKSLTTVSNALKSLVDKGYIIRIERKLPDGSTRVVYRINFDYVPGSNHGGQEENIGYDSCYPHPFFEKHDSADADPRQVPVNVQRVQIMSQKGTIPVPIYNIEDNNRDIPYPESDPGRESSDYRDSTEIEKQTNGAANICSNDSAEGDTPSERFERMLSDARGHRYENCLPEEAKEIASQLSKTFADSPRRQNLRHQIEMCGPIVDRLCGSASSILRGVRDGDEISPKDAVMEAVRGVLRLQGDAVRDSIMSCWLSDNEERIVSTMWRSAEIGVIGGAGRWSKW